MYSTLAIAINLLLISTAYSLSQEKSHSSSNQDSESFVRLLYEYPVGTWIENIAIRPSGELLLTHLEKPELDQLNPFEPDPKPTKLHTFTGTSGLTGIAEIAQDRFAVAAGNFSFTSGGVRDSWGIWNVDFNDMRGTGPKFAKIANVPGALMLNGMCYLPSAENPENILVGDVEEGTIRRVNTTSGDVSVVISNKLTAVNSDPVFGDSGVDGIHVYGDMLYFTSPSEHIFAKMPVNPNGTPAGKPTIISHVHKSEFVFYFDDFTIKDDVAYLVTGSGNSIERLGLDGTHKGRIIAGNLNSTKIAEPTSCAFGRTEQDSHILYVVTGGGLATPVDGNITIGGQVLAVDTSMWEPWT